MGEDGCICVMFGQWVCGFFCICCFLVQEWYGFVWVWLGVEEQVDVVLIFCLEWVESFDWVYGGGLYYIYCDYCLMIDNLMDLIYEIYVYVFSIGQKEIDEVVLIMWVEGDEVIISCYMQNVVVLLFWCMVLCGNGLVDDVVVDCWQICCFMLFSYVLIEVGVVYVGYGGYQVLVECKVVSIVVDFIILESVIFIWYFWGMVCNFQVYDQVFIESICEGQGKIFGEDLEMFESQQCNLLCYLWCDLLKLNIDVGGVQVWCIIECLLVDECQVVVFNCVQV